MKILTYNIHGWRTTDGRPNWTLLAKVLEEANADIIGLNEVFFPRPVEGATGAALEALAQRLQMHFVFGPCLRWSAQDDLPAHAYGNALLSRWPIVASAAHHLTPKEPKQQALLAGKEQRGLLEARILLPNSETFTVYVTHLDHTSEAARMVQLRTARTWLGRDRSRPHIVMGDFNAISRWDYAHRPHDLAALAHHATAKHLANGDKGPEVTAQMEKIGYTDTLTLRGEAGQQSFIPATDQKLRIDYIFASRPLVERVRDCRIIMEPPGTEASDHRPLMVEIDDSL